MIALKEKLLALINADLDAKIKQAESQLASTIQARDSDTKSSAGDKYETSRAMMQIEQAQNEQQLSNLISLKENLNLIKFRNAYEKVELGSLILSDADHFFLTQALGSFQIEGQKFHCLSLASPLGQKLHHKKIGEVINLGNKSFTIKNIL